MSNEIVKVNPVIVDEIEFYVSFDGKYTGMSQGGLARLCNINLKTIQELLPKIGVMGYGGSEVLKSLPSKENWEKVKALNNAVVIPIDICKPIILHYIMTGKATELAHNYLKIPYYKKKNKNIRTESLVRDKLKETIGGNKEVITLAGNIDLLTSEEIIEVKNVKSWKHALGQILVYSVYYPSHQKRIHLFGECQESLLNFIKDHCSKFNVIVTWEN